MDSVDVSDSQVDAELDRRLRYFVSQFGSEQKLEEYYGKKIIEIKEEFKEAIRDALLAQRMQQKVIGEVQVSPLEIKEYFEKIPTDSLPFVNSEVMVAHIVKIPTISRTRKKEVKEKLEEIRQRVISGESMSAMAASYSQDPGSAAQGGEIKKVLRGTMVKEFEAMAYSLNVNEISEIFETQFGFHFIQLTNRRGEELDLRHILLKLNPAIEELVKAEKQIDSVSILISSVDSMTFEKAAIMFSDDEETKNNGGIVINPVTGNTLFEMGEIDRSLYGAMASLKVGDVSKPVLFSTADGKQGVRIVKLLRRTEPHRANMKDDYQKIKLACEGSKKQEILKNWVEKKAKNVFIEIVDDYSECDYGYNWIN